MARLSVKPAEQGLRGTPVLRGVDLEVALGFAGRGPRRVGKRQDDAAETAVRLRARRIPARSKSTGKWCPAPSVHMPPEKRRIGYVAQEGSLFPHLSVGDNVAFGLPAGRAPQPAEGGSAPGQRRPARLLREPRRRISFPAASSSASRWLARWRRRRSWCCSTSPSPRSTPRCRVETRQAVSAALAASGATALLVTHDQSEALAMGIEVAVCAAVCLAQVAAPEILVSPARRHRHGALRGRGGDPAGDGQREAWRSARWGACRSRVPRRTGRSSVMVRPEQIRFLSKPDADAPRARVLGGHILRPRRQRASRTGSGGDEGHEPRSRHIARREAAMTSGSASRAPSWPIRAPTRTRRREPSPSTRAQFPMEPLSAAALEIKERLP